MSRKVPSERPAGDILVRFNPPGSGVPRTLGETLDGDKIIISPNVVRKSGQVCRGIRPPYYLRVLYHFTGPATKISRRGFAITSKATRVEIDEFVHLRGEPAQPELRKGKKRHPSGKGGPGRKGSQRRYKKPAYQDHADDKPAL